MVVKITRPRRVPTRAIAVLGEPLDELKQRVAEAVQRFHSAAVTPRSFLDLENELAALAAEACRQVLEREAPQMIRLITYVADRLGIVVTQKELGLIVPIAGAVLNSSINVAFQQIGHQTAKDYFRRLILEDRYGEELVAYAIQQEVDGLKKPAASQ